MDEFLKDLAKFGDLTGTFTAFDVAAALFLSFFLNLFVAWAYRRTHRGVSYSQSFAHTLIIFGTVVSLVMLVIGSNIARAFALVGALSIIRFRNAVKESRDVAFLFLAMAVGMACGTRFYLLAAFSAFSISCFILVLHKLNLFASEFRERILRAQFSGGADYEGLLDSVFERFADEAALVAIETASADGTKEVVYSVRLMKKAREEDLIEEVRKANGGLKVTLLAGFHEVDL